MWFIKMARKRTLDRFRGICSIPEYLIWKTKKQGYENYILWVGREATRNIKGNSIANTSLSHFQLSVLEK